MRLVRAGRHGEGPVGDAYTFETTLHWGHLCLCTFSLYVLYYQQWGLFSMEHESLAANTSRTPTTASPQNKYSSSRIIIRLLARPKLYSLILCGGETILFLTPPLTWAELSKRDRSSLWGIL